MREKSAGQRVISGSIKCDLIATTARRRERNADDVS